MTTTTASQGDDTTSVASDSTKARSWRSRYVAFVERRRGHRREKVQQQHQSSSSASIQKSTSRSVTDLDSLTAALAFETPRSSNSQTNNNTKNTTTSSTQEESVTERTIATSSSSSNKQPPNTETSQLNTAATSDTNNNNESASASSSTNKTKASSSSPSTKNSSWLTRTKAFQKLCAHAFAMVDTDQSGDVDEQELYAGLLLIHLQLGMYLGPSACRPLSRSRCHQVFARLDTARQGTLGMDEFAHVMGILCSNVLTRVLVQWSMTIVLVPLLAQFLLDKFYAAMELLYWCVVNADEYSSVADAVEVTLEHLGEQLWQALPVSVVNASETLVQAWHAVPDSVWNAAPLTLLSTLLSILVVPIIILQVDDCFQWLAERKSTENGTTTENSSDNNKPPPFQATRLALTGGTMALIVYILLSEVPSSTEAAPSSTSASWQDSSLSSSNSIMDAARHADLSPSMFAPGGRLYSVERVGHALSNPLSTSNNLVAAVQCAEGVVVVATLPESPYLPRNVTYHHVKTTASTTTTSSPKDQEESTTTFPLLATPHTGIPRAPFARLSSTMWAVTAGHPVDSQLVRIKLHRLAETLRHEQQDDRPDVLARRLADNLQVLTQQEGEGSILQAHAVIFTAKEVWRVDPTGQFWKCQATIVGRGSVLAEAKLMAQLHEQSTADNPTATSHSSNDEASSALPGVDIKDQLRALGRDEAVVLCKSAIVDTFASMEKKPVGTTNEAVVPPAMKGLSVLDDTIDWFSTEELLQLPTSMHLEA